MPRESLKNLNFNRRKIYCRYTWQGANFEQKVQHANAEIVTDFWLIYS